MIGFELHPASSAGELGSLGHPALSMKESDVPHMLRETLVEVVENQIRDGDPIVTRQTFKRLLGLGLAKDAAHRLIAGVLAAETFEILKHDRDFDAARYAERLHHLPQMPWLDDDPVA